MMKNIMGAVFSLGLMLTASAQAQEATYPQLFFSYSYLYDGTVCATEANAVPSKMSDEVKARVLEFSALWQKESPALFAQMLKDFGKGWSRKEFTATLTACDASTSYSNPLVIRVLPFLKSYVESVPGFPLFPQEGFTSLVFHETLHTWLVENFDFSKSTLIEKYKSLGESQKTLNHLHLMAIQSLIYAELNRTDLLKFLEWNYPRIKDPAYPRAWEIVHKIEGHAAFISEIKSGSIKNPHR